MSELVLLLPVIFFFLAVVAVIAWIMKVYLAQRETLSAVRTELDHSTEPDSAGSHAT